MLLGVRLEYLCFVLLRMRGSAIAGTRLVMSASSNQIAENSPRLFAP